MGHSDWRPGEFAEFLEGLARGDSAAELKFAGRYQPIMLRAATARLRRYKRSLDTAEDICQTAVAEFLAAARRREIPVDSPERLLGFVLGLVNNVIREACRHDHALRRDVDRLEPRPVEECGVCSREIDPRRAAEASELWDRYALVLSAMDLCILFERVVNGRTFPEIAEIFDLSESNARKHYTRACDSVREEFGSEFFDR